MYSIYDYAYNGFLYLNNIMRPHHKRLSQLMIYSTTACQSRCKHCNIWQKPVEHLPFEDIKRIMQSGKSLFIEKPPCQTLHELDELIDLQRLSGSPVAMVSLQKRYSPAVQILSKRLKKAHLVSYDLHYLTGSYPEGNALLDLYIHPLDLVIFLFGKPEIIACQRVTSSSYILMLQHPNLVGTLELSTAYTWSSAKESIKVCTSKGIYHLSQMETLTFEPKSPTFHGIPIEKFHRQNRTIEYLYAPNPFTPTLPNNLVYSQGYFIEIHTFVNAVEGYKSCVVSTLDMTRNVFLLLEAIKLHCSQ